jgi:cysteine desulfurase family protein (TIGR01976 family)
MTGPSFSPSTAVAAVEQIRMHFPALARTEGGLPVAYFDGPGGTQVPRSVVDAVSRYLLEHNANTHWRYPTSIETDALLADARGWLSVFLNATPQEVAFGANMTSLTFHVARALGRGWTEGDEVVVTDLEHHANVAPWQALARERGILVRQARMHPETGELDWAHLTDLVGGRTKLVALGAASNALGTINDVRRAAELAHSAGALLFVDAVHYAPHVLVDVQAMDCDLLACSAYKFYGPHVGVLYVRQPLLEQLDLPKLEPAPDTAPERLETGTQNHEGIVGTGAAVRFLASLAEGAERREALQTTFDALHARGQRLVERLWTGLRAIQGVTVYGPPPDRPRTPTVSFTVEGHHPGDVAASLARAGVFVSHGDFYATTLVQRLAPQGLVRAGCACYTTEEEVERLIDGVKELARLGRRGA